MIFIMFFQRISLNLSILTQVLPWLQSLAFSLQENNSILKQEGNC